ncbi:MAG: hypothetical protein RR998_00755 [Oscillospiraceae bacterium]
MFVKPKTKTTPDTQHQPDSDGEFTIGTGLAKRAKAESANLGEEQLDGQLAFDDVAKAGQDDEAESKNPEDIDKTQEFESLGVRESDVLIKKKRVTRDRSLVRKMACVLACVLLLVAAFAGVCVFVAEPWIEPSVDSYMGPTTIKLDGDTLSVGEVYPIEITLGPNEKISSVTIDADLLSFDENLTLTALGEYFGTDMVITTKEIRVTQKGYERDIVIFGIDVTEKFFELRSKLRASFGIEAVETPRTELREIHVYEQHLSIVGVPHSEQTIATEIEATKTLDVIIDSLDRVSGQTAILRSENPEVAIVTPVSYDNSGCDFVITGISKGSTRIFAVIGFWKQVSDEEYAVYLETLPEDYDGALRENEIFVAVRDIIYNVNIKEKPIRYYYYKGRRYAY